MVRATRTRRGWGSLGLAVTGLVVWQLSRAGAGTPDPGNPTTHLSHLAVVVDSGILVLRAGLETILVLVAAIGYLTFGLQRRLPYRRMLVATGIMLGFVLLVMVGESVQELQQTGWLATTPLHVAVPGWMSLWFSIFPNVQTVAAQATAALLVIGSYFLAPELRVRRPRRHGHAVALRPTTPPAQAAQAAQRGLPGLSGLQDKS